MLAPLAALLFVLPIPQNSEAQPADANPQTASDSVADSGAPEVELPEELRAMLEEVERLREAGELEAAREHLALLVDGEPYLALADASDEVALIAVVKLDEVASSIGLLDAQRRAWEQLVQRLRDTVEKDHPNLIRACANLAGTMYEMGDVPGAHALFEEVLDVFERTLPEDHHDLLLARMNLAITVKEMGDLGRARALQEAVLAGYERTLPEDHPSTLTVQLNLASTIGDMGDLDGARALQEVVVAARERTLPGDHPDLLLARVHLANTIDAMGDLGRARELREAVLSGYERVLPEGHPTLLGARHNLAGTLYAMGDLDDARALQETVLADSERFLWEDHPTLLAARQNLAATLFVMGDLSGARALQEEVVAARERTLPEGHSFLLTARSHLAITKYEMGDLAGARALQEAVVAARERTLPEDHPDLLEVRHSLGCTMEAMGDVAGARALFEAVLAAYERTLPEDHPDLLRVRGNLAVTMEVMGDGPGARALFEAVLSGHERNLPDDHRDLLRARLRHASTLRAMGDLAGARALQEEVLAAREQTLPEDHPDLLNARSILAGTMKAMGDLPSARALLEGVVAARERILPEDHRDLFRARGILASTLNMMGDLSGARSLQQEVLSGYEQILPEDHPDLLRARGNLAFTIRGMGDAPGARALGRELARGMLLRLEGALALSTREAREVVGTEYNRHSAVRFFIDAGGTDTSSAIRFELAETLRATADAASRVREEGDPRRAELFTLRERLNDLVSGGSHDGQPSEELAAEIASLTLERDRLERQIRGELGARGLVTGAIRAEEVARALPEDGAAVGFLRHAKWVFDPEASEVRSVGDVIAAHVLRPDGSLTELELGPADELAELVRTWRSALGKPVERGIGFDEEVTSGKAGEDLRVRLLDPILGSLGEESTTLYVCLDDFLHLVPIGALPLGEQRVEDHYRLVHGSSFARLVTKRPLVDGETSLLALGGVGFDADLEGMPIVAAGVTAPIGDGTRAGRPSTFPPLLQTRIEVEAVGLLFEEAVEEEPVVLLRDEATKAAFHEYAPGKRFLHVATHGWFAPETIPSTLDAGPGDDALRSRLGASETVTGLAPLTLCGLAFAGANHGRDSLGRVPGIMTAEELAGIDLSACELAVLSACETNVGIRRAGQGVQSLQAALHAAGARTAITSLWRVDDAATRRLMELFYTKLWKDELGKADALWQAKMALRAEGHPVRDWAGWVLTGDPD